jgi:multidrug efflux pump subunit AcrB
MASISAPFIKYPVATSLLMVGVLFVGLVAFPNLPVAPLPQIDFPTIQVTATLPGASPEIMASSVAQPLERQFAQIPGVAQTTSTSGLGLTTVVVQFDLDRNIDAAANDIQSAINAASGQLPRNLPSPPTYRKVNPADSPIMILSAVSEAMPLTEVDDNADTKLAQQISQISGVGQVSIGGEQKPSVRVQLDPAKLYAKGLSLEEVRTPLSITTVNSPKGSVDGDKRSFTIYSNDQLIDAVDWNDVIVAYRDGSSPARARHWAGGRRPGGCQEGGVGQRQAGRVPRRVQAAGRQCHRYRGQDQASVAAPARRDARVATRRRLERSHADDPRLRQGRGDDASAHHCARRPRHLRVPAQPVGDDHPQRDGAARAAWRLRTHVFVRL